MKKQFTLYVSAPCSENWDDFKPTSAGGFCQSCSKNVIDFTKMSEKEIVDFFGKKPDHVCGRFYPGQLKSYQHKTAPLIIPGLRLLQAGLLSLLLMLASKNSIAKTHSTKAKTEIVDTDVKNQQVNTLDDKEAFTINGVVTNEFGELLPGVNVYLKNSDIGTVTDIDGKFRFPKMLKSGDVLIFSYIGFETKEYVIPAKVTEALEIKLEMYEVLMGEVQIDTPYKSK